VYGFIRKLATLDRRIVYLGILVVLSFPFVVTYSLPIHPETYTHRFYDEIERIANDPAEREKVILVLHNWGPGTSGENRPQFDVIMRHLLRPRWDEQKQEWYKLKFIFLCSVVDPVFHDTAMLAFDKAKATEIGRARRLGQPVPTWVYGEDYLDFGFKNAPVFAPLARSIVVTPRDFYGVDYVNKRDLTDDNSYPLLQRYRSIDDVSAVLVISAGDESRDIAGLVKSDYPDLRVGPATMGIVATELYPYVKSDQLFGLINSARGASEYRSLLDADDPGLRTTTPTDNAMSAGKTLLLVLVVLGNVAFLITRRAEQSGKLERLSVRGKEPLPRLPAVFMWGLFAVFVGGYGLTAGWDCWRSYQDHKLTRERVEQATDDPAETYPDYERVGRPELEEEMRTRATDEHDPMAVEFAPALADTLFARMIEHRVGEYFMVFCTLGVFAFCLGDNRFYRFVEAIIVGGSMAYMLIAVDKLLIDQYGGSILSGVTGQASRWNLLWLGLLVPGALWYFTYSKKYRWLNQLIVACFLGLAAGPEFKKQINLVIPQILDSVQPLWPWTSFTVETGGETITYMDPWSRIEHLVFVVVLVLSLIYFIFFFRPKTRVSRGVVTAGRLVLMIGFGASFGNTVNTRLSWLAPRIGMLWEDWLGKLLGG